MIFSSLALTLDPIYRDNIFGVIQLIFGNFFSRLSVIVKMKVI
jgi:hypothetical protein